MNSGKGKGVGDRCRWNEKGPTSHVAWETGRVIGSTFGRGSIHGYRQGGVSVSRAEQGDVSHDPDVMWADASLKDFDIRLWCVLSFYARGRDHCDPTDASIAATMGVSVATVKRGLMRLEAAGFLDRRHDSDGNRTIFFTTQNSDRTPQVFRLRVAQS